MSLLANKLIMCAGSGDEEILPEAIDFDGTNDYLSRSSDLVGNTDGKTFTFSCWVYNYHTTSLSLYSSKTSAGTINIYVNNSGTLYIQMVNATGTEIRLNWEAPSKTIPFGTWVNIIISMNMASTSYRHIYVSDKVVTGAYTFYANEDILFAHTDHYINSNLGSSERGKGRLSHAFLDYTYRDLSTESNRRLFCTEDLKPADPATLIALNPIMYMQLTDPDTAHVNSGTGGDFVLNGTVALSERGPNQDNCVASEFDGSADYLSVGSVIGLSDGKELTLSFNLNPQRTGNSDTYQLYVADGANYKLLLRYGSDDIMQFVVRNSSNTVVLNVTYASIGPEFKTYSIDISVDLTNAANRHFIINGVDLTSSVTWSIYTNNNMDLTGDTYEIGRGFAILQPQTIGEFWFNTSYTDLSTSNPFWDSDLNKPVPVRQVIENTGVTPLIALPIRADDAGNNLGTGGDFTLYGGGLVGARGVSEFWARSANFDGSTNYLSRTTPLVGSVDSKQTTLVFSFNTDSVSGNHTLFHARDSTSNKTAVVCDNNSTSLRFYLQDSSGQILAISGVMSTALSINTWYTVLISDDRSTSTTRIYVNEIQQTPTPSVDIDSNVTLANVCIGIGVNEYDGDYANDGYFDGDIGFLYFSIDYIDFSQESNRLLFVDALGYPTDLQKKIDAGEVPEPLIYMPFDDTSDFGVNSGTGGDFTENGTITAGADIDPNA